jgi:hypothetical protein
MTDPKLATIPRRTSEEIENTIPATAVLRAGYGDKVPWPCPDYVEVECPHTIGIRPAMELIELLARVPQIARPDNVVPRLDVSFDPRRGATQV